ncbi:MAG: integrin alpha [Planctomycetota bacterium]
MGGSFGDLFDFRANQEGFHLGSAVSDAGDLDGDGVEDFVVGAPGLAKDAFQGPGSVFIFSSSTGRLLLEIPGPGASRRFGHSLAGVGDVDGDGQDDFLVGDPDSSPAGARETGAAFLFSGADGTLIYKFQGPRQESNFGFSASGTNDLDGDGVPDVLVGAPNTKGFGEGRKSGSAFLYSGLTGRLLRRFDGTNSTRFGYSVSGGADFNADGTPDLVIGAPFGDSGSESPDGSVFVYSGVKGELLFRLDGTRFRSSLGHFVLSSGDLDGDGAADLFAESAGGEGDSIQAFSGATRERIWIRDTIPHVDPLADGLAPLPDLDGDGAPDLLAMAPYAWLPGTTAPFGKLLVLSGRDGTTIREMYGPQENALFGAVAQEVGDVDGDGAPEFLVGSPQFSTSEAFWAGAVDVVSSASSATLLHLEGSRDYQLFGFSVAKGGDMDGDGLADLIVGAPQLSQSDLHTYSGEVIAVSGATREPLWRFQAKEFEAWLGLSLAKVGDIDGDGVSEILAGAPRTVFGNPQLAGSAYLISGRNGRLLNRFDGTQEHEQFGKIVSSAGDADGEASRTFSWALPIWTGGICTTWDPFRSFRALRGTCSCAWKEAWPTHGSGIPFPLQGIWTSMAVRTSSWEPRGPAREGPSWRFPALRET